MTEKFITLLSAPLKQEKILYLIIFSAGICLSLFKIHDSVINRDAIVYISTAENFLENGFAGTFRSYSWLSFSILGAMLSKVTSLSLENSFYFINTFLYALIPVFFVRLYHVVTDNKDALPLVGLLILLLPSFNGYRDMIIRDVGFWCFSLLALLSFLRFAQTKKLFHSIIWQLAIGMAIFFRLEGLAWLIGLPLCLLWMGPAALRIRTQQCFLSISLYVALLFIGVTYVLASPAITEALHNKLHDLRFFTGGIERFNIVQNQITQHILNEYSREDSLLILMSGLLAHFFHVVLATIGFLYIGLAYLARKKQYEIKCTFENKVIIWALFLCIIPLLAFLIFYQFMIERYAVLVALLTLILIAQPIIQWIKTSWPSFRPWIKCVFGLLAIALLMDLLTTKNPPPTNLKAAGEWLKANTDLNTPIAISDNRLLHYSGRLRRGVTCVIDRDLDISLKSTDTLKHYPYLVIEAKKESLSGHIAPLINNGSFEKIEEFTRGKRVVAILKNTAPSTDLAIDCNPFR